MSWTSSGVGTEGSDLEPSLRVANTLRRDDSGGAVTRTDGRRPAGASPTSLLWPGVVVWRRQAGASITDLRHSQTEGAKRCSVIRARRLRAALDPFSTASSVSTGARQDVTHRRRPSVRDESCNRPGGAGLWRR